MAISRQQFSPQSIAKLNEVVRSHEQDRGSDPSGRRQFLGGTTPLIYGTTDDTIADEAAGTMTTDAGTTMPILNRTGASLSGATQVWAHWWGAGPGYVVLPTGEGGHEPHLYGELDEELEAGMSATMSVHDAEGDTGENVTLVDNLMPEGSSFPAGTFVWASWHEGDQAWYLAAAKSCPEGGPEGGVGVTDHGQLSGLGDDDHPHYSLRNGTRWTTTQNGERVAVSDASGNLVESDITTTELAALDGIEGNIEDRLDALEAGGGTGGFTANRVIISDGSGDLAASDITATELDYLDGVSSNIQTQLDGKAASSHSHAISDVTGLSAALAGKADSVHSHSISDVTGLSTALAGKADANHTHDIEDIDGLEDALDGKADSSHTHAASDITSGTFDNARIAQGNVTQHQGAIDHGSIAGLSDDDHSQYALLAGRSGGQTIIGGTGAGEALMLKGTAHATPGAVQIASAIELPQHTVTANTTLTAAHHTVFVDNDDDVEVAPGDAPASCPGRPYKVQKISSDPEIVEVKDDEGNLLETLYVQGDWVELISDGTAWRVIGGYLTPHFCELARESPQTNLDDNTIYKILHDTTRADTGGLADLANSRVIIRRPGKYILEAPAGLNTASQIVPLLQSTIRVNSSAVKFEQEAQNVTPANMTVTAVKAGIDLQAGDVIETAIQFLGVDATKSTLAGLCSLAVTEVR